MSNRRSTPAVQKVALGAHPVDEPSAKKRKNAFRMRGLQPGARLVGGSRIVQRRVLTAEVEVSLAPRCRVGRLVADDTEYKRLKRARAGLPLGGRGLRSAAQSSDGWIYEVAETDLAVATRFAISGQSEFPLRTYSSSESRGFRRNVRAAANSLRQEFARSEYEDRQVRKLRKALNRCAGRSVSSRPRARRASTGRFGKDILSAG